jgi:signal peptide peptidase SppA
MRFAQLTKEIFCKPCLITPQMHAEISKIFMQHVTGLAHEDGGCAGANNYSPLLASGRASDTLPEGLMQIQGDIAIINISGPITQRISGWMKEMCGMTDLDDMTRAFKDAEASPRIRGILLNIDSPGGSVTGVPEFGNLIANCRKPVVAFTDSMCDSAAYWIAAGAKEIVATESASVGCIGVYMAYLDQSKRMEMNGLDVELFKTGTFKGMGYPGTSLTEEHRALMQAEVNDIHAWFTGHVNAHRAVSGEDTFQGQDFTGREALKRGLVDMVGSFDDAMNELRLLMN